MATSKTFLDQLSIKHPIIQAPMAGVSTPALAAAVSNAGGLGSIALGASTVDAAKSLIQQTRTLTDKPFNVNFFCHKPATPDLLKEESWLKTLSPFFEEYSTEAPLSLKEIYLSFSEHDAMIQMLLKERPAIVSFHFGIPPQATIKALETAGIYTIASATNLHEAQQVEKAGINAVVAQGWEAGGHRGCFDPDITDERLNTFDLVRLLSGQLTIPVIAAGGLMNGTDITAALDEGAVAAQLGTAFITCPENKIDPHYQAALLAAEETIMTRAISGRPARSIRNRFTDFGINVPNNNIPDYPIAYDAGKALHAAAKNKGEHGFGAQWAGSQVKRIRPMPADALMETLLKEMLSHTG